MNKNRLFVCLGTTLALSLFSAQGAESKGLDSSKLPPAADKTGVTYARDIKPVFEKSCVRCHGADKPKARLRLDSLEAALKGSADGKVVAAGNSADSILVHCVAHAGKPDTYMPPPRNKANIPPLTKDQVGLVRAWIDQGAK